MILLLLPHQDDEFGAFGIIDEAVRNNRDLLVVYLTDGSGKGDVTQVRDLESLTVLKALGLSDKNVLFLEQRIPDGQLVFHLDAIFAALFEGLPSGITSIYVTAWEGGHHDHDAAALLAVALGHRLGISDRVFQFPLYNAHRCRYSPFALFNPIAQAGPVLRSPIGLRCRIRHLILLRHYLTQLAMFMAFSPWMLRHYFGARSQITQQLTEAVVSRPPHDGQLLYERRGRFTWGEFEQATNGFRARKRGGSVA